MDLPASRHRLREEATFRAGVRTIAAAAVVVSTWLGVTLAWFVTQPPWFGAGARPPLSLPRALVIAGGSVAAACALALVAGLLGAKRWRRSALTAWASASSLTAISAAAGAEGVSTGAFLLVVATLAIGTVWLGLTILDRPSGDAGGVEPEPPRW